MNLVEDGGDNLVVLVRLELNLVLCVLVDGWW